MGNILYTNGAQTKSILLPEYPDSAWDWLEGKPDTDNKENELYSRVSAVYRVANMTADAIANMPFNIINDKGDEVDSSEDWQNVIGYMQNPKELLRLWRLSLFMTNSAYGFMDGNRAIRNLRYIAPTSITPIKDKESGLTGFKRTVGNETKEYPISANRIFWMYRLDHTVELLPSENTEMRALMAAAGVLFYSDYYVENFFQRGGIKPSLLFVKGSPTKEDRERIENAWDKIIRGVYKFMGKVFNSETMTVQTIGDGIENLTKTQIHSDKISDIAMAAGMPLSLLLANSANYATAQTEKLSWLRDTIYPYADWMQEEINNKLLAGTGLHWNFQPELKVEDQEEESARAAAYAQYIASGMRPSIAAQVVGLDLPASITPESLDEEWKTEPDAVVSVPTNDPDEEEEPLTPAKSARALTTEEVRELSLWEEFAFRKHKRGESLNFPFVCKVLDEDTAAHIRSQLSVCNSAEDIKSVFDIDTPIKKKQADDGIMQLVAALNRAADISLKTAEVV